MKNIYHKISLLLLLVSGTVFAQEQTAITLYNYHANLFNPAYVGMNNKTFLTSTLRRQWTGVPDAPSTQTVSFGTPIGKNLGFGLSVINDDTFIEKQNSVAIDFSYKVQMNYNTNLYFGLKGSGNFYNVNLSGLETYNLMSDPALTNIDVFTPNVGVGMVLQSEKWFVSLASPRILNTSKAVNNEGFATGATDRPHVYLSGGHDFDLSSSFVLKPSALLRYVNGAPVSIDLNTMLNYEDKFEIGATYRTDQAYALMSTITLSKRFMFGFAYEMSTRPTLAAARNTNEILLRFQF